MMHLSPEELRKIAHLARIMVYEHEIPLMLAQIQSVLSYAVQVREVAKDTPVHQAKNVNIFRSDDPVEVPREYLVDQAPEVEANLFVVPKILDIET